MTNYSILVLCSSQRCLLSAIVSVYAQAIAAILILIGFKIRWAALVMVVNFTIAYMAVHWGEQYDASTAPLAMLFCNVLFLFTGAGKYSFDREVDCSL